MPRVVPIPTPVLRFIHMDNLAICLQRSALHAPNFTPDDGLVWRTNHNPDIQARRREHGIPCGPGGVVHDYVPFYFGFHSPMMYQLHTGYVTGYTETQEPLIYLVTTAESVQQSGADFVFSDGHGIATWTRWFSSLDDLGEVDWAMVAKRYWRDTIDDMDRQRRKQAEFLIHRICDWSLIHEIVVIHEEMKTRVEGVVARFQPMWQGPVVVRRGWYY